MLTHPTLDLLHDLGLHGMAKSFRDMADNPESVALGHAEWLGILLEHDRWADATNVLLVLQAEYVDWLAALPDSLRDSPTAEALEAIADLDLTALAEIMPPRGYGRD